MLDINIFRKFNEKFLKEYCKNRNIDFSIILTIVDLDKKTRKIQTKIQVNKAEINKISSSSFELENELILLFIYIISNEYLNNKYYFQNHNLHLEERNLFSKEIKKIEKIINNSLFLDFKNYFTKMEENKKLNNLRFYLDLLKLSLYIISNYSNNKKEELDSIFKKSINEEFGINKILHFYNDPNNISIKFSDNKNLVAFLKEKYDNFFSIFKKELRLRVWKLKAKILTLENDYNEYSSKLRNLLMSLPNIPSSEVPYGKDELDNVEQKKFSLPRKFNFKPKPHWDLILEKDMADLEAATNISGSRYVIYKGLGARLIRALQWYTLECNISRGYTEYLPPVIVDEAALYNTSQLPKFKEDLYKLENESKYLSPTAEVQLTNINANKIISSENLPLHYTSNTSCFRSEAGSAGRDTRGVIRQHQFYKTELVKICMPENSEKELELLTEDAEYILESLDLPYRRILLCSNDMGFSAKKTYDLEVWLPSYNAYKEISSCSNCGDFQSRRMKMRTRNANGEIIYPHTLNGSSLAIDRLFAAVVENYQQEDGSILIPDKLRKYFGNIVKI